LTSPASELQEKITMHPQLSFLIAQQRTDELFQAAEQVRRANANQATGGGPVNEGRVARLRGRLARFTAPLTSTSEGVQAQ
jgi:hypothetical protein